MSPIKAVSPGDVVAQEIWSRVRRIKPTLMTEGEITEINYLIRGLDVRDAAVRNYARDLVLQEFDAEITGRFIDILLAPSGNGCILTITRSRDPR